MDKFSRIVAIFNIMMQQFLKVKFELSNIDQMPISIVSSSRTNPDFMRDSNLMQISNPFYMSHLTHLSSSVTQSSNSEETVMMHVDRHSPSFHEYLYLCGFFDFYLDD